MKKRLIKILDNTRSAYAFFARKIILVEGETDRFFFKELIAKVIPDKAQEIAVLDIGGKPKYKKWKDFFEKFGLMVYFITDFDYILKYYDKAKTNKYVHALNQSREGLQYQDKKPGFYLYRNKDNEVCVDVFYKSARREHINLCKIEEGYAEIKASLSDLNWPDNTEESLVELDENIVSAIIKHSTCANHMKLNSEETRSAFKNDNEGWEKKIDGQYKENIFILKQGALEDYLHISRKELGSVIEFCNDLLENLQNSGKNQHVELKNIIKTIVGE